MFYFIISTFPFWNYFLLKWSTSNFFLAVPSQYDYAGTLKSQQSELVKKTIGQKTFVENYVTNCYLIIQPITSLVTICK